MPLSPITCALPLPIIYCFFSILKLNSIRTMKSRCKRSEIALIKHLLCPALSNTLYGLCYLILTSAILENVCMCATIYSNSKTVFSVFSFVQSLSQVQLFATPWTAAHQASLSFTISWSLLKLMSIELVMPSNHLILCFPLLL